MSRARDNSYNDTSTWQQCVNARVATIVIMHIMYIRIIYNIGGNAHTRTRTRECESNKSDFRCYLTNNNFTMYHRKMSYCFVSHFTVYRVVREILYPGSGRWRLQWWQRVQVHRRLISHRHDYRVCCTTGTRGQVTHTVVSHPSVSRAARRIILFDFLTVRVKWVSVYSWVETTVIIMSVSLWMRN